MTMDAAAKQAFLLTLEQDPDFRTEIRRILLTTELLELPEQFAAFVRATNERFSRLEEALAQFAELTNRRLAALESDVATLKDDVATLKDDVVTLKDDVVTLKDDVATVKDGQSRMSGQLSHLMGHDYEAKAIEQARRLIRRRYDMEKATLLYASRAPGVEFEDQVLIPAIRESKITRQEADQLEEVDCIIRCDDPSKGPIYAVVEISVTVQDKDHARAVTRAEIFSRAIGHNALPHVVGQREGTERGRGGGAVFVQYEGTD